MPLQTKLIILTSMLTVAAAPILVHAQTRSFPPISHSGFLGYEYNLDQGSDSDIQTHAALFNWDFSSYIKQPYIAQYFGGVTLRYNTVNSDSQGSNQQSVSGNLEFRVFPMSRFPFAVYLRRSENHLNETLGDLVNTQTAYGLSQHFRTRKNTSYVFRYEENQQSFDDRVGEGNQNSKSRLAQLDVTKKMEKWSFRWENQYLKQKNANRNFTSERIHSILRHTWRPVKQLSMNGFTTYRDVSRGDPARFTIQNRRLETNNYLFWRPNTKRPMVVNSSFRHVENFGDSSNPNNIGSRGTTLSGGLSYQATDRIDLSAFASSSLIDSSQGSEFVYSSSVGGRVSSPNYRWRGINYTWTAALFGKSDNISDELGNIITAEARLGHDMNKVFFPGSRQLHLRFSQYITAFEGTDDRSTQQLNQHLSVSWNRISSKRSSTLMLSISDFRSQGGDGKLLIEDNEFQIANLMFSQSENFSRYSRLTGSISVQARRQRTGAEPVGDFIPSGSADISYNHRMLFNVPGLQFRSSFRWYSTDFNTSADDPLRMNGIDGAFWENQLEYRIGRLDLKLTSRLTSVNGIDRNFILFQVRRHFGGFLLN